MLDRRDGVDWVKYIIYSCGTGVHQEMDFSDSFQTSGPVGRHTADKSAAHQVVNEQLMLIDTAKPCSKMHYLFRWFRNVNWGTYPQCAPAYLFFYGGAES